MNDEELIKDSAAYVDEYLRIAKGITVERDLIELIIDLHLDFILLTGHEEEL